MTGNVWEWCEDDWHDSYETAPKDGTAWVDATNRGANRVHRGGGWDNFEQFSRTSNRNYRTPTFRHPYLGFRILLLQSV